jgi:hypothetical protein
MFTWLASAFSGVECFLVGSGNLGEGPLQEFSRPAQLTGRAIAIWRATSADVRSARNCRPMEFVTTREF